MTMVKPRVLTPVRLREETLQEVDALAKELDTTRAEVLRQLIARGLESVRKGKQLGRAP